MRGFLAKQLHNPIELWFVSGILFRKMVVLYLWRVLKIDGCASNNLKDKDPQQFYHLVRGCRQLFGWMDAIRQHFRSIRQSGTETCRTGCTQRRWTDNNEGNGEWGSGRSIYSHLSASVLISWVIQMCFRLDPCNTLTKNGKTLLCPSKRVFQRQSMQG